MVNEKRLIDADKLRGLKYEKVKFSDYREGWNDAIDTILTELFSPTVDAVEVVHGEWRKIYTCHGEQAWGYECNQCKIDNPRASYYCPNCGAKMDGDGNGMQ